ncbi:MAG: pyridoxamine 5'-phosphate oxidase [Pseudomonadota bacterium]
MSQYDKNPPLLEADALPDPLAQFARWMSEAEAAGLIEPTAMTLATVNGAGQPSARMVLFKGLHEGAFTFYTNYKSRKGLELSHQPKVSLLFWWDQLQRQIRIEGRAQRLSREMSEQYFHARPRASQLSAMTSRQSQVVATRDELDARYKANEQRLEGQPVPHVEFWGGFGVKPELMEFWQGRRDRLHDRLLYRRDKSSWKIERLEP